MKGLRIALIGDFRPEVLAHRAIPEALHLAAHDLQVDVLPHWVHTSEITSAFSAGPFDGVWCVPASPYANSEGALSAIRSARERNVPFLGTCGGFQHAVIEYARNVLMIADADHAENNPNAPRLVIVPLACALVEKAGDVFLVEGSKIGAAYGTSNATEEYHCSYGVGPAFRARLDVSSLAITAVDAAGDVRAIELRCHPFFVATLFQPERAALRGMTPPLVKAFVRAAARLP